MFLEHSVVARERPPAATPRALVTAALGGFLVALSLLILLHVIGEHRGAGLLPLLTGLALLADLFAHVWPVEYTLTDNHLRVRRGLLAGRWVPLDQIRTVAGLPEGSEYCYHGFSANGTPRPLVIVNPELGDRSWVIFTPSESFTRTLLWQIGRSASVLDPLPDGPPLITVARPGPGDEDDD